jgi:hypothetical protein
MSKKSCFLLNDREGEKDLMISFGGDELGSVYI